MKANYLFFIMFFILISKNTKLFAQIKAMPEDLELVTNNEINDQKVPIKLQIDYTCDSINNGTKFKINFTVKAISKDYTIIPKVYNYEIRSNNVSQDFKKEIFINNIILYFYLTPKTYSNVKEIREKLNEIFDTAINSVKLEVERTKSNNEIDAFQKRNGE